MNDYLVAIGKHKTARKLASGIGIPVPENLIRNAGPWVQAALKGNSTMVGGKGVLHKYIAEAIAEAGGQIYCTENPDIANNAYENIGDKVTFLSSAQPEPSVNGLVYDGSHLGHPGELSQLHQFFQKQLPNLRRNGRIIVIARPYFDEDDVAAAATFHALEGFVRSCAKEVGRRGSTAHLITVESNPEAQNRLKAVLSFLLSNRSAFISGQIFRVTAQAKQINYTPQTKPLQGKVALVTGAARGIGAATARRLAGEGASVICLDRPADEALLSKVALEIGGQILLQDLQEADAAKAIQGFILKHFGSIDILVHNAGITRDKTLAKMNSDTWNSTIQINLTSVLNITACLLTNGIKDGGRIICLSSIAGIAGNFGQTNYAASKSGVIGFVKTLSQKVAHRGITVNGVAPGFIETRLTKAIPFVTREAGRRLSNVAQGGVPDDIAQTITFLASPGGIGVNGEVIRVCGGSLIGA